MLKKIIIAGFGGQGVMSLGKFLGEIAMHEGKYATYLPSYGPEMRGGTAHCMVCIADSPIATPYVEEPDICLLFTEPALLKFFPKLARTGYALINRSLISAETMRNYPDRNRAIFEPFTEAAQEIGSVKVTNVVGLSRLLQKEKVIQLSNAESFIRTKFALDAENVVFNVKALHYFSK